MAGGQTISSLKLERAAPARVYASEHGENVNNQEEKPKIIIDNDEMAKQLRAGRPSLR